METESRQSDAIFIDQLLLVKTNGELLLLFPLKSANLELSLKSFFLLFTYYIYLKYVMPL